MQGMNLSQGNGLTEHRFSPEVLEKAYYHQFRKDETSEGMARRLAKQALAYEAMRDDFYALRSPCMELCELFSQYDENGKPVKPKHDDIAYLVTKISRNLERTWT